MGDSLPRTSESPCAAATGQGGGSTEEMVVRLLGELVTLVRSDASERWASLDLTIPQWRAFFAIAREPDQSIGGIAKRLGIGLPAASHLIDKLVRARLVEREADASDRRLVHCRLSPAGQALFADMVSLHHQRIVGWLERMEPEEVRRLADGLAALVRAARQDAMRKEVR